jgi:membrane-bound serine protease (ClpP class)
MPVGPNTAFVLLILGVVGIYCELIWPGRVAPGVIGAAAAVTGSYFLFRWPLERSGLVLIGAGALFLIAEACWGRYLLLGALGAIALTAGFCCLLPGPRRIVPELAIPLSAIFGLLSAFLAAAAKRARRNKWADLEDPK